MAQKDLVPMNKRTKAEQKRIATAGGKASGEARRRRKLLKDNMNLLLDLPVSSRKRFNEIAQMYVNPEDIDNAMLLTVAMFKEAADGNVRAFQEIRDLVGEGGDKAAVESAVTIIDDL